jgi:hypothetical protein
VLLDRGDADAGLLAWSRAVDACPSQDDTGILRIGQARALAQMRRLGEAQGLIDAVAASGRPEAVIAQAFGRSLALRRGEAGAGMVDAPATLPVPVRGAFVLAAAADHAVALHARGRTDEALRLLTQVRAAVESVGEDLLFAQCLQLEMSWLSGTGDEKRLDAARRLLDAWESER